MVLNLGRVSALGFLVASATAAQAFYLDVQSRGTFVNPYPGFTSTERVVYQDSTDPVIPLTDLSYTAYADTLLGSGFYTSSGADGFKFDMTITAFSFSGQANLVSSASGTWTYTAGSGGYAGLTGGGTWSGSYNAATGSKSFSTFVGQLNPVPEPASLAVLGVGLVGLVRRRRR